MSRSRYWIPIAIAVLSLAALDLRGAEPPENLPYPRGQLFPLLLYSVPSDSLQRVADDGFNLVQTYVRPKPGKTKPWAELGPIESWLADVGKHKLRATFPLSSEDMSILWEETDVAAQIEAVSKSASVVEWWYLPEEMTWTDEVKFGRLKAVSSWARKYDPERRPTFEYLAGNYIAFDIRNYVPHVDVIAIGAYVDYNEQPRQWVRWAVKQTIQGIEEAGYTVGPDYLAKQRVPAAVLQLFVEGGTHRANGPETYHDVWNAVCSGAKAICVFSWGHRSELPPEVYAAYAKAARQLTSERGLGKAILFGSPIASIKASVTKGPKEVPPFDTWGAKQLKLPSVNLLAIEYLKDRFILAVNDTPEQINAQFDGLPGNARGVAVIDENRSIKSASGSFTDEFAPWGVHLYRIE